MAEIQKTSPIGIIGAGTIGIEIAYSAISAGYQVMMYDVNEEAIAVCTETLLHLFESDKEIEEITEAEFEDFNKKLTSVLNFEQLKNCPIVFEAIVENERIKEEIYTQLESVISPSAVIATTTSTLSVNKLATTIDTYDRFIGTHFLNPQFESKVVEVVSGLRVSEETLQTTTQFIKDIGYTPINIMDSPGFICHRILAVLFIEAINIIDEGLADYATIDWALKTIGNFDLGPFEIIDMLGTDDVNKILISIYNGTFQNPKFRPSVRLKKMVEAKFLGQKSGEGFYDYQTGFVISEPTENQILGEKIYHRIMDTLCNEAYNLVGYKNITKNELELVVKEGLKFPVGLFEYATEKQPAEIRKRLQSLYSMHLYEAHKPSLFLK